MKNAPTRLSTAFTVLVALSAVLGCGTPPGPSSGRDGGSPLETLSCSYDGLTPNTWGPIARCEAYPTPQGDAGPFGSPPPHCPSESMRVLSCPSTPSHSCVEEGYTTFFYGDFVSTDEENRARTNCLAQRATWE